MREESGVAAAEAADVQAVGDQKASLLEPHGHVGRAFSHCRELAF
jgi:hypothetical protein